VAVSFNFSLSLDPESEPDKSGEGSFEVIDEWFEFEFKFSTGLDGSCLITG
jgi:hypothetical protein